MRMLRLHYLLRCFAKYKLLIIAQHVGHVRVPGEERSPLRGGGVVADVTFRRRQLGFGFKIERRRSHVLQPPPAAGARRLKPRRRREHLHGLLEMQGLHLVDLRRRRRHWRYRLLRYRFRNPTHCMQRRLVRRQGFRSLPSILLLIHHKRTRHRRGRRRRIRLHYRRSLVFRPGCYQLYLSMNIVICTTRCICVLLYKKKRHAKLEEAPN